MYHIPLCFSSNLKHKGFLHPFFKQKECIK
nr:MAG TPA: hypothetical protein [Caudoviricetes sp.]DAX99753.1 MAG TPA: hypothetical protein [Caudoviricetes sp.]